jgi:hypothetical protein
MFKTLKGKVNGLIFLGLLFAGGIALGNSDAGASLKMWYDQLFNSTAATFNTDYQKYLNDRIGELETDKIQLNSESQENITNSKDVALTSAKINIDEETEERINSLIAKKDEISLYMGKQFDDLLAAAKVKIDSTSSESLNSTNESLRTETQDQGKVSLDEIEEELAISAEEAVSELETEIEKAKLALKQQLDNENVTTTEEVKAIIDAKIAEIRLLIAAKNEELTRVQQTLISQHAKDLEESVKEQLDSAIDSGF